MFSPDLALRWHPRSRVTPLVCEIYPSAAMRTAFCPAIAAKQGLQVSGGRPALARSWLMSDCWVEPMIGAGRTTGWATVAVAWVAAVVDGVEAGVADGVTGASRFRQSCFGKGARWTAEGAGLAAPAS